MRLFDCFWKKQRPKTRRRRRRRPPSSPPREHNNGSPCLPLRDPRPLQPPPPTPALLYIICYQNIPSAFCLSICQILTTSPNDGHFLFGQMENSRGWWWRRGERKEGVKGKVGWEEERGKGKRKASCHRCCCCCCFEILRRRRRRRSDGLKIRPTQWANNSRVATATNFQRMFYFEREKKRRNKNAN